MKRLLLATCLALILFASAIWLLAPGSPAARSVANSVEEPAGVKQEDIERSAEGQKPAGGAVRIQPGSVRTPEPEGKKAVFPSKAEGPLPLAQGSASLQLELVRARGGPLAGATITLLRGRKARSIVTEPNGKAVFDAIEPGVYSFAILAAGLPGLVSAREITLADDQEKRLRIVVGDYSLSIAGRVLDSGGKPIEGIEVTARRRVDGLEEGSIAREDQESLTSRTERSGRYEIQGVDATDFTVRTTRSGEYPEAFKVTRGGSRSVDFVLGNGRKIEVHGKTQTRAGEIVPEAAVSSLGQGGEEVVSDAAGQYAIEINVAAGQSVAVLGARKEGYRESRVNLRLEDADDTSSFQLDLVLDELGAQTTVAGLVKDSDGAPLAGQRVVIHSGALNSHYEGVSDGSGRFAIEGVQSGKDYGLTVYPKTGFKDFSKGPIEVSGEDVDVEVVLERLASGSLDGVLVDASGAPVPNFTLWLRSLKAQANSVALTSDASGAFSAREIPEGDLLLETRSEPRIVLRGLKYDPSAPAPARLVVDWGAYQVEGVVLDETGAPLAGASVSMTWAQSVEALQTSSYRAAVTDASGRFAFTELGPGGRKVTVTSPRHLPAQASVDPASSPGPLSVQLKPKPGRPVSPGE